MDQIEADVSAYALRRLKQSARAEVDARRKDPEAMNRLVKWLAEGWQLLGEETV